MLKLHTVDSQGITKYMYFTPYSFKFYKDPQCTQLVNESYPYKKYHPVYTPSVAILPLGYGCPNRCLYCIQHGMKNPELNIHKLYKVLSKYKEKGLKKIHFVGGEPLLQWDLINRIMNKFSSLQFSLITNGIHLNLNIAEELVRHKCKLTISYDGESQLIQRGKDIFHDHTKQFELLEWLSTQIPIDIVSVLCSDSTSLVDRFNHLLQTGINYNAINIRPIIPYRKSHLPLVSGSNDWKKYLANLITDIYTLAKYDKWNNGNQKLLQEMRRYHTLEDFNWSYNTSHCHIFNRRFVTINQSGELQYCHNCTDTVNFKNTEIYKRKKRLDLCTNCPVLLTCNGMCRIIEDDDVWRIACTRTFYFQLAYWIYFIHQTYGCIVTAIEGEFLHNPEKIFKIVE